MTVTVEANDLAIRVGDVIEAQGYVTGDSTGYVRHPLRPGDYAISVLSMHLVEPPGWFRPGRRAWYGTLWTDNSPRRAVPSARWVFEVHGGQHLRRVTALSEHLASAFGVVVHVVVVNERDTEPLPHDWDV